MPRSRRRHRSRSHSRTRSHSAGSPQYEHKRRRIDYDSPQSKGTYSAGPVKRGDIKEAIVAHRAVVGSTAIVIVIVPTWRIRPHHVACEFTDIMGPRRRARKGIAIVRHHPGVRNNNNNNNINNNNNNNDNDNDNDKNNP
ncbi:hypothetical protein HZH66_004063 [Vespula vulgaris]|uniref:Uncharacterized protein n=1 Tax=Vespula vulgaris TaxID=7454 RepID=A0A834KEH0_VESVU|nr:hypothetical protein HZH66_004063 [Vespula vulgaris]